MDAKQPRYSATLGDDPLAAASKGDQIQSVCLKMDAPRFESVPLGLPTWDAFDGSLLAVGVLHDDRFKVWGTAVMIGPGLALTATHVLANHHEQIRRGEVGVVCAGMRLNGTLEAWQVRHVGHDEGDLTIGHDEGDLTILSLQLATPLVDGGRFTSLPLSTRTPLRGERLSVVGFRFGGEAPIEAEMATVEGWLYAAAGEVGDVSHPVRDKILAPYPTIEILCGALGGMSGGAVLDREGVVVGIVSRSLNTDDGEGPTLAAWVIPALALRPTVDWPPGLYPADTPLVQFPNVVRIVGREYLRVTGTTYGLALWHG
jgi:S1-C subfamily serine protease